MPKVALERVQAGAECSLIAIWAMFITRPHGVCSHVNNDEGAIVWGPRALCAWGAAELRAERLLTCA